MTASENALPMVRHVFALCLRIPLEEVQPDSTPDTLAGWDSIHHLQALTAIAEELKIDFTIAEMSTLSSIGSIAEAASAKLGR